MARKEQIIKPNYKKIYNNILDEMFPEKKQEFSYFFNKKQVSSLDIIDINNKIFGYKSEIDRKHYTYLKSDIIEILNYQKKHCLNDAQLAKHFNISRNSVAKWKKIFL